jgi:hypothetical protein
VQQLLARNASVNARAADAATPLHVACRGGHARVVRTLVLAGAAVSAKDAAGLVPRQLVALAPAAKQARTLAALPRTGSGKTAATTASGDGTLPRLSSSNTVAVGEGLHRAVVGQRATFRVLVKSAKGRAVAEGGASIAVRMRRADAAAAAAAGSLASTVSDHGDGTYTVAYTPTAAGAYTVDVSLDKRRIAGSPFALRVLETAARSTAAASGTLTGATAGGGASSNSKLQGGSAGRRQRARPTTKGDELVVAGVGDEQSARDDSDDDEHDERARPAPAHARDRRDDDNESGATLPAAAVEALQARVRELDTKHRRLLDEHANTLRLLKTQERGVRESAPVSDGSRANASRAIAGGGAAGAPLDYDLMAARAKAKRLAGACAALQAKCECVHARHCACVKHFSPLSIVCCVQEQRARQRVHAVSALCLLCRLRDAGVGVRAVSRAQDSMAAAARIVNARCSRGVENRTEFFSSFVLCKHSRCSKTSLLRDRRCRTHARAHASCANAHAMS